MPPAGSDTDHRVSEPEAGPERRNGFADFAIAGSILAIAIALTYGRLHLAGVTNVWEDDGLNQHLPALVYYVDWLRGLLARADTVLPTWSWELGLGADIVSTLSFYALGDPFALIALAFPPDAMESAFEVMMLARVALAGLLAWVFFRVIDARRLPSAIGALVYCLGAFSLLAGLRHPFFLNGLVLLPAILIGIERALKRRQYAWLVASVALGALGSLYFLYAATIIAAVYGCARYVEITPRGGRRAAILPTLGRMALFYALGVALAAPVLLPTAHGFLGSWRSAGHSVVPTLYRLAEYGSFVVALAAPVSARYATYLGFGIIGLMALPVVFSRRSSDFALKVMLAFIPLCIAIPALGSAFNGFTFPSNRFAFAWGLFLGLATARMLSRQRELSRGELIAAGLTYLGWLGASALASLVGGWPPPSALVAPALSGGLTLLILLVDARVAAVRDRPPVGFARWRAPVAQWALLALLLLNLAGNAAYVYRESPPGVLAEYLPRGSALERFREGGGEIAAALAADDSGHRVENLSRESYGDALVNGYPGTAFYFSVLDGRLTQYLLENGVRSHGFSFRYSGFDDRAALTTLAGVKWHLTDPDRRSFVPFGFDAVEESRGVSLHRNQFALPIGFVYETAMNRTDYERLAPLEKEQALLQSVVLESSDATSVERRAPATTVIEVPFSVGSTEGAVVRLQPGRIESHAATSSVTLEVDPVPGAELYLSMEGYDHVVPGPFVAERAATVWYSAGGGRKPYRWFTRTSPYYWGLESQLVNLGYQADGAPRVRLDLTGAGTVSFDRLRLLAVPMDRYAEWVRRLQAGGMRDIERGPNRITGTATATRDGILFLSVPYSEGWSARVDGRPVRPLRVNTAFTGIPLAPGTHSVSLTYETPWLREGLALSFVAVAVLAALWVRRFARRRARQTGTV